METKKIIPALFLISLSLTAKPSDMGSGEATEKLKNNLIIPSELFENKMVNETRLSFKVNNEGKAEEIIVNSENEKIKNYVLENISKIKFDEKGKTLNLLVKFKLQ